MTCRCECSTTTLWRRCTRLKLIQTTSGPSSFTLPTPTSSPAVVSRLNTSTIHVRVCLMYVYIHIIQMYIDRQAVPHLEWKCTHVHVYLQVYVSSISAGNYRREIEVFVTFALMYMHVHVHVLYMYLLAVNLICMYINALFFLVGSINCTCM